MTHQWTKHVISCDFQDFRIFDNFGEISNVFMAIFDDSAYIKIIQLLYKANTMILLRYSMIFHDFLFHMIFILNFVLLFNIQNSCLIQNTGFIPLDKTIKVALEQYIRIFYNTLIAIEKILSNHYNSKRQLVVSWGWDLTKVFDIWNINP